MRRLKTIGYALSHLLTAIIWGEAHMSFCGYIHGWKKSRWLEAKLDEVFGAGHCRASYGYCSLLQHTGEEYREWDRYSRGKS